METKLDFQMVVLIIRNKHQWVALKVVMHLSLISAIALLNVTGSQIDFDLVLNDGSTLVHTEKVSFTVAAGGSDAVSLQADNGPVDYTVSTAEMSVSNNTTTEPDYENTATTSAASLSINYNPEIREADDRHFAMAGQNALFTFNGVDIIREENEVEDLISGVKLTLNDTTSSNITIGFILR